MPGSKRSDEEWQSLFEDFERSGQRAAAFCRERGLPAQYFRTKYRQRAMLGPKPRFAKVQVATHSASVYISIADVQIRCDATTPPDWIAGLIQRVRA